MKRLILLVCCMIVCSTFSTAAVRVTNMRVSGLSNPIGIDQMPTFSWQTESDERGFVQQSYEITVTDADGNTVWQTGTVASVEQSNIGYEGSELASRSAYRWTVTVAGANGERSEAAAATFETAFMNPSEWTAKWIGTKRDQTTSRVEIVLDKPAEARYFKIDITKLGLQAEGDWNIFYVQFAEVEVYSGATNVAIGATFTPSSVYTPYNSNWNPAYINDGIVGSTKIGYTSAGFNSQNQHVTLLFDLGSVKQIDRIVLYPRQDTKGRGTTDAAANFPSSYSLQVSTDNSIFKTIHEVTDASAPLFVSPTDAVPCYGRSFSTDEGKTIRRARLYATALGIFTMQLNGHDVTDNWLEPGETGYDRSVIYSTYDVTSLLTSGKNTITAQVAGGMYSVLAAPGRYSKPEIHNSGTPCLLAELFIDYDDGSCQHLVTDGEWLTVPSPVTASNWWGGEDYDARRELSLTDLTGWTGAQVLTPTTNLPVEKGGQNAIGTLRARCHEPVRVMEAWRPKSVRQLANGNYIVDFGQNFAGQFQFRLKGTAGQTLKFQTGETLNADGTVNAQSYYGGQIVVYDTYTFASDDSVTWSPRFMYHGFRYMEVSGLTSAPTADNFMALRLRNSLSDAGTFQTSNPLINQIHTICRNAIQSQLFNTVTDCPQREKIGWLDVPNQLYNSIAMNFDFQTLAHKIVQDCFDAQAYYTGAKRGKVPSTVPHYFTDWDDDPNWGGSAILLPYRTWKTYGDRTLMERYYDGMKQLIDYYTSLTSGYIMPGSSYSALSDWGQSSSGLSQQTTPEFTITCTYYYLLTVMAEMARETGHEVDATTFEATAANVRNAFNARFYDTATAQYEFGNQAELAMPLYYGLVDDDQQQRVADKLAGKVKADNYKIKTGECGLKPVLMMLARYGYNDIVWQMANQTDNPSYGYFVENGCTTTPELWNMAYSQNHCMLDHIEEWLYAHLAGIRNEAIGYGQMTIAPYVPEDLNSMRANVETVRGKVTSSFTKLTDGIRYQISVPANSTATLILPCPKDKRLTIADSEIKAGSDGIISIAYNDSTCTLVAVSGDYTIQQGQGNALLPEVLSAYIDLQREAETFLGTIKINDNTGYYKQSAVDEFKQTLEVATLFDQNSTIEQITKAYETFKYAYEDFIAHGKNEGSEPTGIEGTDYSDLTVSMLKETDNFARTDATLNSGRFGAPKYWTVENFGFGSEAGIDNITGTDCLHLEVWWNNNAFANAGYDIHNARLYQRVVLPAGRYCFAAAYPTAEANDLSYIFAAEDILNTSDISTQSIAYEKVNVAPADGTFRGIYFTLDEEKEVCLGFQADFSASNTNNIRVQAVKLLSYDGGQSTGVSALLNNNEEITNSNVYDLQGRKISNSKLNRGIYILKGKKIILK